MKLLSRSGLILMACISTQAHASSAEKCLEATKKQFRAELEAISLVNHNWASAEYMLNQANMLDVIRHHICTRMPRNATELFDNDAELQSLFNELMDAYDQFEVENV